MASGNGRCYGGRTPTHLIVLVHGTKADVENLHEDVAQVLAPMGLRLSAAKTQVVHMSDGFDFLGFHIRWKRKRGRNKWHVYTFIADRPIRSVKAKIRALTNRRSQQDPGTVLIPLGQIMRGWANYFKHAACKRTLSRLSHFVWWRVIRWLRHCIAGGGRTSAGPSPPLTGGGSRSRRAGSSCSAWKRCRSPATATGATRFPIPGRSTTPNGSDRGEPGAVRADTAWCCASMRKARSRRWIAPSRCCR